MSSESIVQLCDLCGEPYYGPDLGSNLERVCPDCCHLQEEQQV